MSILQSVDVYAACSRVVLFYFLLLLRSLRVISIHAKNNKIVRKNPEFQSVIQNNRYWNDSAFPSYPPLSVRTKTSDRQSTRSIKLQFNTNIAFVRVNNINNVVIHAHLPSSTIFPITRRPRCTCNRFFFVFPV